MARESVNTLTADEVSPPPLGIPAEAAGSQATGWFGPGEAGSKVKTLEILSLPDFLQDGSLQILQTPALLLYKRTFVPPGNAGLQRPRAAAARIRRQPPDGR